MPALPPGPPLGRLAQTLVVGRDPVRALVRARDRYGPVFTLRFATTGPVVAVAVADEVPRVVHADPGRAHAGEARRRVLPYASRRSSFGGDEAEHATARGRVAAQFAPERVEARRPLMAEVAERQVAGWPRGRPVTLLARSRALASELFARCVLGVQDDDRVAEYVRLVRRLAGIPVNPPVPPPGEGDGLLGAAFARAFAIRHAPLAAFLVDEVERRRAGELPLDPAGDGVLDAMARTDPPLERERVVDELTVLVAAAQEPMAFALSHVLDRLGRSPAVAERVRAEGTDGPFFTAVVDETLRLRPPALASLRRLTVPGTFAGHALPAGVTVMAPIPLVHRDPGLFPEPDAFRPERFLDAPRPPQLIPFGGGARVCVGQALAWAELREVVPAVLRRARVRPLSRRPERLVQRATVLAPVRGGLALLSPAS